MPGIHFAYHISRAKRISRIPKGIYFVEKKMDMNYVIEHYGIR